LQCFIALYPLTYNNYFVPHIFFIITNQPSHYCEKVRWGFDLLESDPDSPFYYTEDPHPPLFHSFFTAAASRGEASSVPMVVGNNNSECLHDSTRILKRFCPFLYAEDIGEEVDELEQMFDSQLGPSIRCVVYYHYLQSLQQEQHLPKLADILTSYTSNKIEKALFRTMLIHSSQMKQGFLRAMNINSETAQQAEQQIHSIFAKVSDRLLFGNNMMEEKNSNSDTCSKKLRQYLCCDGNKEPRFTAADLTFAALASPLIMPKELLSFYDGDRNTTPTHLINLSNKLRQTSAGQHVLTMYHRHRFGVRQLPSKASCAAANATSKQTCDPSPTKIRVVVPKCIPLKQRNTVPWVLMITLVGSAVTAIGASSLRAKL